jgi:hypothetical protein
MIQHSRASVTPVQSRLCWSGPHLSPKTKTKNSRPHMFIRPTPEAVWPLIRPSPSPTARSSSCSVMPFPPSPAAPLTCIPVTCAARSLAVHPSSIVVECVDDPARCTVSWRLRSSPVGPRAPTSVASAGGGRSSSDPTTTTVIDWP